ncbi:hypothetical protein ACGFI9_00985 [Micromonospora sp. NPDC048930]|uniref:hypothetical protein n=1 Tax=Micromonospora sp. NPDC048930 TaxID=3364261 RepID=UPI003713E4F9
MQETAQLAGFFAAHGIWCVSDGGPLTPLLGVEHADGSRGMHRFVVDDLGEAARAGQKALRNNEDGAARAVLVVDGYVHLETGRTDALIIEAVDHGSGGSVTVAVPYRPEQTPGGFAVHRPKFLDVPARLDLRDLGAAFFTGVAAHEKAATVWNDHLDESV